MRLLATWGLGLLCVQPMIEAAGPKPIQDPRAWARRHFEARFGDATLVELSLDLDQDGVPELFLGAKRSMGTGGGTFLVLRKRGAAYLKVTELEMHPHAIRTLKSRKGDWRFATYWHMSAGSGILAFYSYNGRRINLISRKDVESSDPMVSYICDLK